MGAARSISRIPAAAVAALAIAASALLGVSGCGGGGPQSVDAAELVQKGDEICAEAKSRFAEIQSQPPANAGDAADQTGQVIDAAEREIDRLRDLEPPDELRAAYDRYLDAQERALDLFRKGREAAENQDSDGYVAAQEAEVGAGTKREKLARAVGFKVCGKPDASA
jgi:hypothetical protein